MSPVPLSTGIRITSHGGARTGAGTVRRVNPLKFSGPILPDGEPRDLYVVDGLVTYERPAGAESAGDGWIVPGLVDAHCHLGLDDFGAVGVEETEQQAIAGPRRRRTADP